MKYFYLITFLFFVLVGCQSKMEGNPDRFKQGVFSIPAGEGYSETIVKRVDSLQIEEYTKYISISSDSGVYEKPVKRVDTLYIKWKNNFFYILKMKSPKTKLDKDPVFVQITKVTDSSYSFSAKIGYSKFKQEGTVYKVK